MKKTFFFCILAAFRICLADAQEQDTIYFDADWQETSREKASFFRPLPLKEKDGLVQIVDFYVNGNIQMKGWVYKEDMNKHEGEVTWFYKNGSPSVTSTFENGILQGTTTKYFQNGNKYNVINYKNGEVIGLKKTYYSDGQLKTKGWFNGYTKDGMHRIFDRSGRLLAEAEYVDGKVINGTTDQGFIYKNGQQVGGIGYYENTGILAFRSSINPDYTSTMEFYERDGSLIDSFQLNVKDYIDVAFHPTSENGLEYTAIRYLQEHKTGKRHGRSARFDKNGKLLYEGIYKNGEPYSGTLSVAFNFTSNDVSDYRNGQKDGISRIVSSDGKVLTEGVYREGTPFEGNFLFKLKNYAGAKRNAYKLTSFKQGVEDGKVLVYGDIAFNDIVETYGVTEGKINGKRTWFDENGIAFASAVYQNDAPVEGVVRYTSRGTEASSNATGQDNFVKGYASGFVVEDFYKAGSKVSTTIKGIRVDGLDELTGSYKNNKPDEGFFLRSVDEHLVTVDCYKKGRLKYKYLSTDLKPERGTGKKQVLTIEKAASYNNRGEIVEGKVYAKNIPKSLTIKYFDNRKLDSAHFFTTRYRLSLEYVWRKNKDGYEITTGTMGSQILKKGKHYQYYENGVLQADSKTDTLKTVTLTELYYLIDGELKSKIIENKFFTSEKTSAKDMRSMLEQPLYRTFIELAEKQWDDEAVIRHLESDAADSHSLPDLLKTDLPAESLIAIYEAETDGAPKKGLKLVRAEGNKYSAIIYSKKIGGGVVEEELNNLNEVSAIYDQHFPGRRKRLMRYLSK